MAYDPANLSLREQSIGGLRRSWDYRTTDAIATVSAADYFTDAEDSGIQEGDELRVIKTDADPPQVFYSRVVEVDATYNASIRLVGEQAPAIGAQAAQPAAGSIVMELNATQTGFRLKFTMTAARMTITDAAGSGSHGSLKLFDFVEGAVSFLGTRQDYTAFAEGAALTGGAGDAVFEIGVGTTAIAAAADGTLGNGVNENVGQAVAVTLAGGTGTGTAVDGAKTSALNGTATALDLFLNVSGSAATIDASSTLDVTGTIEIVGVFLGDD
jgi:hypothetical protein